MADELQLFEIRIDGEQPPAASAKAPRWPAGPVYQGVRKTVRRLQQDETFDKKMHAATIAQLCSIARSIDRASGHFPPYKMAAGMQLAALHSALGDALQRILPGGHLDPADPLSRLVDEWAKEDLNAGSGAEASHGA